MKSRSPWSLPVAVFLATHVLFSTCFSQQVNGANKCFEFIHTGADRNYAEVRQCFDDVWLASVVGEISVFSPAGDTATVRWEYEKSLTSLKTEEEAVYRYNSLHYSREVISEPFAMRPGDTLGYWYYGKYILPQPYSPASPEGPVDLDTVHYEDTLIVVIELLRSPSGERVRVLDSTCYLPVKRLFLYAENRWDWMMCRSLKLEPNRRFAAPADGVDGKYRIRVVPILAAQRYGNFSHRAIYVEYFWEDLLSVSRNNWPGN